MTKLKKNRLSVPLNLNLFFEDERDVVGQDGEDVNHVERSLQEVPLVRGT